MSDQDKKMTRKEKIAAGVEKAPKRKRVYADKLKELRQDSFKAVLKNYPTSPRKMRLVADLVRGMNVDKAMGLLGVTPNAAAEPLNKLLRSAIANWEDKNDGVSADMESLFVKEVYVDSARVLKRIQPAPQGRAHRIKKRSNHVTLVLDTRNEDLD